MMDTEVQWMDWSQESDLHKINLNSLGCYGYTGYNYLDKETEYHKFHLNPISRKIQRRNKKYCNGWKFYDYI